MQQISIGMLLFPGLTQLDLTGPYEVFSRMPGARTHLLWKTLDPVRSERGLALVPDLRLSDCPPLDVIFVPGGPGVGALLEDDEVLGFLSARGAEARHVTAVCTGALVLAAAGLLEGYRATTHWLSLDLLPLFGVTAVAERVVIDRNRITGGGVTAGIDFALVLAAELLGPAAAQEIQLLLEYDPRPPFEAGSPRAAPADLVARVREARQPLQEQRRAQITALLERRRA